MAVLRIARGVAGLLLIACAVILTAVVGLGPALPLMLIAPRAFRAYTSWAAGQLFTFSAAVFELVYGVRTRHYGDGMPQGDGLALLSSNHRTRLDWATVWPLMVHYGRLSNLHIVLKAGLRNLPYVGWVVQLARHVFLERRWEADAAHLTGMLQYIADAEGSGGAPTVFIFPEGTDLSAKNLARSHEFAGKQGLPQYQHVLHPRTRGFAACATALRTARKQLRTVYDVTLAYGGAVPQKESQLLTGRMPHTVHALVTAYPAASLPADDAGMDAWMVARFAEKERLLADFYAHGGRELRPQLLQADGAAGGSGGSGGGGGGKLLPTPWLAYTRAAAFIGALLCASVYAARTSPLLFWGFVALHHLVMAVVLRRAYGGADKLELGLYGGASGAGTEGRRPPSAATSAPGAKKRE
jgi:1-acyl-sn-glycerol-3-phosphate acyltransferase